MVDKRMHKQHLIEYCELLEGLLAGLGPEVTGYLYGIGQQIVYRKRDYKQVEGVLLGIECEIRAVKVGGIVQGIDENGSKIVYDVVETVPKSALVTIAFLKAREQWQRRND
jgi:hypothetical protein